MAQALVMELLRPTDAAWLAALRIGLGLLLCVSMVRFLAYGWIDRFFVEPTFHFKYWGFGWIEPLPAPYMHGLFVALAGLAFAVAIGALFRISAILFAAGLSYVQLIDVTTYLNHYYLAALLSWLLALSPAHRMWSVDAWLARRIRRRGSATLPAAEQVTTGLLYLFRFQVGVVYVFAGLAKLQSDWLLHGQPLRIWLGANVDLPVIGPVFTWPWIPVAMSWAGFLFDTTIVVWLAWHRTRPFAYAAVIAFHVMTRALFPIGMFPAIMVVSALVFFPSDWPRGLIARLAAVTAWFSRRAPRSHGGGVSDHVGRVAGEEVPAVARAERPTPDAAERPIAPSVARVSVGQRAAIAVGLAYCVVQLLLPLRAYAYGGNVLWHEQGMRFSWRVMVRAKGGSTTFVVRDRANGRTFHVSPRQYLSDLQESEMSSQPDLILQLARHIRRDLERRGMTAVEVRADARVSLNGRPSVPLIDPEVDLGGVEDGLGRAEWISPAPSGAPPHTRPVL